MIAPVETLEEDSPAVLPDCARLKAVRVWIKIASAISLRIGMDFLA